MASTVRLFGLVMMAVLLLGTYVNGKSIKTEETRSEIIQILKRLVQYDQQGNLVKVTSTDMIDVINLNVNFHLFFCGYQILNEVYTF